MSPPGGDSITDLADEAFYRTFQINVYGPYLGTKRQLPLLLKSDEPRVVNIGSDLRIPSSTTSGVYSVTKAALHALTVATANDLSGRVAVNVLCPGWVRTDMAPDGPGDPTTAPEAALWLVNQPHELTGRVFQLTVEHLLDG